MTPLPQSATGLIKMLDKNFPPRCIRKGEDIREAERYAGKRELVDMLLSRLDFAERQTQKEVSLIHADK